jgi:amino acid adenylation domain-containing protein
MKVPASKIQSQFWLLNNKYPDTGAYNLFSVFLVNQKFKLEIFQKAAQLVVNRHEALKTNFKIEDGTIYQSIKDEAKVNVSVVHIDDNYRDDVVHDSIFLEVNKPFDLSTDPLYRFTVFKFRDNSIVLALTFHHIIIDVRSEGVFAKEISEAYEAIELNVSPKWQEVPFQHSDYLNEINEWYDDDDYHNKLKSFLNKYPDPNISLELPIESRKRNIEGLEGTGVFFYFDDELSSKIKTFGESLGVNAYRVLLAAYSLFLKRLSGQSKITIGLPLTNRTRNSSKTTFGCFINALPLNVDFDDIKTVEDLISEIDSNLKFNLERQEVPFIDVVQKVSFDSSQDYTPYFQVGFAFKPQMELSFNGVPAKPLKVVKDGTELDLMMFFHEEQGEFHCYVEYSINKFTQDTITLWIDNFKALVNDFISDTQQLISKIKGIGPLEEGIISRFNNTHTTLPSRHISDFFSEQVLKSSEKTAIVCGDSEITYSDLDLKIKQLSAHLENKNIAPQSIIGICMDRSIDMVICMMASLRIGATYLPLDPNFPSERLDYMVSDSGAKIILTQQLFSDLFVENEIEILIYNSNDSLYQHDSLFGNTPVYEKDSFAYMMYTSGSTGNPKGIKIHHEALMNFLLSMGDKPGFHENDVLLAITTISFDISILELFLPLLYGGKIILAQSHELLDGKLLIQQIVRHNVSVLQATPGRWNLLLQAGWTGDKRIKALVGGEALPPQLIENLLPKVSELWNMYGPTETTVWSTCKMIENSEMPILVGKPINNTIIKIRGINNRNVPIGCTGEVCIGGKGVAKGYFNNETLTTEKFVIDEDGDLIYKTGDKGRINSDLQLELFGRIDNQIKLRGYRIEPNEIESQLNEIDGIKESVVKIHKFSEIDVRLVAFLHIEEEFNKNMNFILNKLRKSLPDYMVPSFFYLEKEFPETPNGKINKKLLTVNKNSRVLSEDFNEQKEEVLVSDLERNILNIYKEVVKIDHINIDSNFFEIGGSSILAPIVVEEFKKQFNIEIRTIDVFQYPSIAKMASFLSANKKEFVRIESSKNAEPLSKDIAIIGMAGYFPGAENINDFWENIIAGKSNINYFTRNELLNKGVNSKLLDDPDYVYANANIERGYYFDANFFNIIPREADFIDPQHRLFLETCYLALENGGYTKQNAEKNIGVFAGTGTNNYLLKLLMQNPEILQSVGEFQNMMNSDKDFLTTRVSYKLNLTGPSLDIQSACSTSLVALHIACQSLLNKDCKMALAGGSYVHTPSGHGYMYKPGGILSPTGYCRPFDNKADGTILGEGAGAVLLKPLEEAQKDGDFIYAIIKSTAINNDGADKVGYMAPSVEGQSKVIAKAQQKANVTADTIAYVETHGTGTKIGDPIEITALKQVFAETNEKTCALGAVKANIGHLDAAAGVAGLIKTVLALKNKMIPPLVNFTDYNSDLNIDSSPFYAPTVSSNWERKNNIPRRAAVSSFGIGGTNAHCILEEWEDEKVKTDNVKYQFLPFSGKTELAVQQQIANFQKYFQKNEYALQDIAYTLQKHREVFDYRQVFYGKNPTDLQNSIPIRGKKRFDSPQTVFLLTGQGSQYFQMAKGLYDEFEVFRNSLNKAFRILEDQFKINFETILFGNSNEKKQINHTEFAQPLIVSVQYSLYTLLKAFGVQPDILIGHSIGELTAACISGVFTYEDTLYLAGIRGKIMQAQASGSMMAVGLSYQELINLIPETIEISLINAPNFCVVSGDDQSIQHFKTSFQKTRPDVLVSLLNTSHAFHSRLMNPAITLFEQEIARVKKNTPKIPFISNVSGHIVTDIEAMSASYWGKHIREKVNFADGINYLVNKESLFIEVGPGNMLSSLLAQFGKSDKFSTVTTLPSHRRENTDVDTFMSGLAKYWIYGGTVDWSKHKTEDAQKISIPGYVFESSQHLLNKKNFFSFDISEPFTTDSATVNEDSSVNELIHVSENESNANDLLSVLVKIWSHSFGKKIEITDDFFELGGHSLLASQITTKINKEFKIKLPLDTLFKYNTIQLLESFILSQEKKSISESLSEKTNYDDNLILANNQLQLWVMAQFEKSPAYNIPFSYRIKGNLNTNNFKQSIQIVFENHPIFFSYYVLNGIKPSLKIADNKKVEILELDFSKLDINKKNIEANSFLVNDIRKVFDLSKAPLYRISLLKIANDEYIFHLTIHHICFDGWSWGILAKQINSVYNALMNNKKINLQQIRFQYSDFIQWQQNSINGKANNESVKYWKKKLENVPGTINFPYDFARKNENRGFGGRETFTVPESTNKILKNLCSNSQATTYHGYLAAFSYLLSEHTGDRDICIGTPVANRAREEFEDIIGYFVNTIVLRLIVDTKKSFKDLLANISKEAVEAYKYQDLPFDKVIEVVKPARKQYTNPIFQIMFTWMSTPPNLLNLEGLNIERYNLKEGVSPMDITLFMWEQDGVSMGEFEFDTTVISRDSIVELKDKFLYLLNNIVKLSDSSLDSIEARIAFKTNNGLVPSKTEIPNHSLHDLIRKQTIKTPNQAAIIFQDNEITYKVLDIKSNQLANILIKNGIKRHDIVGICMQPSIQMIVSLLGVLKAGASYLPLDPSFPAERIHYMIEDSNVNLLIANSDRAEILSRHKLPILSYDVDQLIDNENQDLEKSIEIDGDDIAYLIYTSGSTGLAKGVKVHHKAVVNFLNSMSKKPGFSENDTLLAVTTLSFDISVLEIFLPLIKGGTLVLASKKDVLNGERLKQLLVKNKISVFQATPVTWNLLLSTDWEGNKNLKALCGGEPLPAHLIDKLLPKIKELWNMYGPTETTVWSTCKLIRDSKLPVLVGKPIDNTSIWILDDKNTELPNGSTGEVCIGGDGVSKGYHNRDELTLDRFIRNSEGDLLYKTGDLGRITTDGELELFGRIDNQIKLRGFRIEPGEIEARINKLNGVIESVVKVHSFNPNDQRLVAFIHTTQGYILDEDELIRILSMDLPKYMVPHLFQLSDDFPRTPNGKIDRKLLVYDEKHIASNPKRSKENTITNKNTEEILIEIWKQNLKISKINIDDNYFDIGGNSMTLLLLLKEINNTFNNNFDVMTFFEHPTIRSLSEFMVKEIKINQSNRFATSNKLKALGAKRKNKNI